MEITPAVAAGRMVIQAYGGGRFRVAGEIFEGSILVFRESCRLWAAAGLADLDGNELADLIARPESGEAPPELLLVGCGAAFLPPPKGLRASLKARGIVLEWMDTGAACRTFNVLAGEDRRFAAAILAVD